MYQEKIPEKIHPVEDKFKDLELLREIARRKQFEFQRLLKTFQINPSMKRDIYCEFCIKTFGLPEVNDDWQLKLFGSFKPNLIQINDLLYYKPQIGNSYLGFAGIDSEIQVYNVFTEIEGYMKRTTIPAWILKDVVDIQGEEGASLILGRRIEFDMSTSTLTKLFYIKNAIVRQKFYAHRSVKNLVVNEVDIENNNITNDYFNVIFNIKNIYNDNEDVKFKNHHSNIRLISFKTGTTRSTNKAKQQTIYVYHNEVPLKLKAKRSYNVMKMMYLMTISDSKEEAYASFNEAMEMTQLNMIYNSHSNMWKNIWKNNGLFLRHVNTSIDQQLISAQYYMMINSPNFGRIYDKGFISTVGLGSLEPIDDDMGFSNYGLNDYNQELWMTSYLALINPLSLRTILANRLNQMEFGIVNAKFYSFKGIKYPVASIVNGDELLIQDKYKDFHITNGMVSLAVKKYFLATGDFMEFKNSPFETLLREINNYWISVLDKNQNGLESLGLNDNLNVTLNSVFNAGLIKESLLVLSTLYHFFDVNIKDDKKIQKYLLNLHNISEQIQILFDKDHNYNPAFQHFQPTKTYLSYPEGVMLRYPLDNLVDLSTAEHNFNIYHSALLKPYKATAISLLFIQAMELEKFSKAKILFQKMQSFSNNRLKMWSCTNQSKYATKSTCLPAAAAYIDAVLTGFVGLKIRRSGLYLRPNLLPQYNSLTISYLYYLNNRIEIYIGKAIKNCGLSVKQCELGFVVIEVVSSSNSINKLGIENVDTKHQQVLTRNVFPIGSYLVIKRIKSQQKLR